MLALSLKNIELLLHSIFSITSILQFIITLEKVKKLKFSDPILNPISVGQFEGNRLVQARVIPYSFQHKKGELSCDAVNSEPMSIQNKIKEDVDITYTYSIKFEENNNVSLNFTNVIGHSSMPMINEVKNSYGVGITLVII